MEQVQTRQSKPYINAEIKKSFLVCSSTSLDIPVNPIGIEKVRSYNRAFPYTNDTINENKVWAIYFYTAMHVDDPKFDLSALSRFPTVPLQLLLPSIIIFFLFDIIIIYK